MSRVLFRLWSLIVLRVEGGDGEGVFSKSEVVGENSIMRHTAYLIVAEIGSAGSDLTAAWGSRNGGDSAGRSTNSVHASHKGSESL